MPIAIGKPYVLRNEPPGLDTESTNLSQNDGVTAWVAAASGVMVSGATPRFGVAPGVAT